MGQQIIKQPNGLYAVWSSIVDDFVVYDATPKAIIDWRVERRREEIERDVLRVISDLGLGQKPYYQFTQSWDEAVAFAREQHDGKCEAADKMEASP